MENRSYWESVLFHQSYDLIVVGAGLTGLSTAFFYKKVHPEARILVVERGTYPIGASTRNAGFACIGTVGEHLSDLNLEAKENVGKRIQERYKGLLLVRQELGDEHIDFEESGGWEIFNDQDSYKVVEQEVDRINVWIHQLLGISSMYEVKQYNGFPAIYNRTEGMIHPGKMILRLIELSQNLGIHFRWNTAVSKVDSELGKINTIDGTTVFSERIVLASNAFTNALTETSIKPGRGYVFVTNELPELEWKGTFHFDEGYVYFRNIGSNRILLGGGRNVDFQNEETHQFGINSKIKDYLVNFSNEILKLPSGWEIEMEWSGIMGFTDSKSPIFERVGKTTYVVAGLSGMGVALGMQLGKTAAQEMYSL